MSDDAIYLKGLGLRFPLSFLGNSEVWAVGLANDWSYGNGGTHGEVAWAVGDAGYAWVVICCSCWARNINWALQKGDKICLCTN